MNKVFREDINDAYEQLDNWLKEEESTNSIIDYLRNIPVGESATFYLHYCQIVTYVTVKRPNSTIWSLFLNLTHIEEVDKYIKEDEVESFKKLILDIITCKEYDKNLMLARKLYYQHKINILPDGIIIKVNDLMGILKEEFLNHIIKTKGDKNIEKWLHDCIEYTVEPSGAIFIDKECLAAYRKHIEKTPKYYIQNFVRLAYISSDLQSNSIACEPLWKQIFGDQEHFEAFIERCEEQNVPGIQRVKNFWRLYKANDMNPIEFEAQGNVQEKIDSDLTDEIEKLEQLEEIEEEIDKIPLPNQEFTVESKEEILTSLNDFKSRLSNIPLYIRLNGRIKNKIDSLIEQYQVS